MREFIVTVIALFAAALSTGIVFAALGGTPLADVPTMVFLALSFSLIPAFGFGGILFVVLRSFHLVRWWSATLGGIAVGALVATLFATGTDARQFIGVCVLAGATAGLAFWLVWRAGTRDKALGAGPTG